MGFFKTTFISFFLIGLSFFIYRKTQDYPDHSNIKSLPHRVSGNKDSNVMLIFLHGYPNTMNMWNDLIGKLNNKFYCLNISYPNYSDELVIRWGMDFKTLTSLIKKTIDLVEDESNKKYHKVLVAHDWGSILSYFLEAENPDTFVDLISFDVSFTRDKDLKTTLMSSAYQWWLATAFYIGGPIGKYMTNAFIDKFVINKIQGLPEIDRNRIDHSWNYMYFYLWTNILKIREFGQSYFPKCPFVFVYGKKKAFMFHTNEFLERVSNHKQSEVIGVETGHWMFDENLDMIVDLINKRH